MLFFLGTYTKNTGSQGIYALRLNPATGALSEPIVAAAATDPNWIELSPDRKYLYAVHASTAQALAFSVDLDTGRLTPFDPTSIAAAQPPSHLAVDATGRVLLSANYREGYVSASLIRADGTPGTPNSTRHEGSGPDPKRQDKPHVHSVTVSPDNRFVVVADLGLDNIFVYALETSTATLTLVSSVAATQPGGGPRHFKFSRDGRFGYSIEEMGGTVTAYTWDAARGILTPIQTISTLPPDFAGLKWNAEVRIHPNGKFLYASNRTHDSIAVFSIEPKTGFLMLIEIVPSGGKTPRNFALSGDGRWLVCGHQDEAIVTVFAVDGASGRLTQTPHSAAVPAVVCVAFAE